MTVPATESYRRRVGATLRGLLNDLKRNEDAAAAELGVDAAVIRQIIAGERDLPMSVIESAVRVWPVSERDFFPLRDDAPAGARIMRAAESARSSRTFQRAGHDYYEYRDTAMTSVAMLRPEWIRILHHVDDSAPDNPSVRWNKGHFLYQFTYFVGDINYYYEFDGRRGAAEMQTGDSVFGLPFAPHSFATRRGSPPGIILALTFGGRLLGDPVHELAVLGAGRPERFALESADDRRLRAALLHLHLTNGAYSASHVARSAGLSEIEVRELLTGAREIDAPMAARLAAAMRINLRDLLAQSGDTTHGVRICRGDTAERWLWPGEAAPAYLIKELAGSLVAPFTRSLEITVLAGEDDAGGALETSLHQYGYCLDAQPIVFQWTEHGQHQSAILHQGDSFCVKPLVPHAFRRLGADDAGNPKVLILRVGGRIVGDTQLEASILGPDTLRRAVADAGCWYDAGSAGEPRALSVAEGVQ